MNTTTNQQWMIKEGETPIVSMHEPLYEGGIVLTENNTYILWCGDYVANVWEEEFAQLSTAIARLAVLQHLAENEFTESFSTFGESFNDQFAAFAKWNTSNTKENQ